MVINFMEYIKNREEQFAVTILDGNFEEIVALEVKFKGGVRSEEDVQEFLQGIYDCIECNEYMLGYDLKNVKHITTDCEKTMIKDDFKEFTDFCIFQEVNDGCYIPVGIFVQKI